MRPVIAKAVRELSPPDEALLEEARQVPTTSAEHSRFLTRIEALRAVEYQPPSRPQPWPGRLRVAALNAERMKDPSAVRKLLDAAGAHVGLFSEVDVGMARSGNRHTIRDLAQPAGEGWLYGVEFVELDLGDAGEIRRHADERNACGFHGNAIVTGLELGDTCLIPLEESGLWFPGRNGAQRRIGGRIAVAARLAAAARPLWVVSVHLESKTDSSDRQAQIWPLLRALEDMASNDACIIGGDFNTKALPRAGDEWPLLLEAPERYEPLFADLRSAGFKWTRANLACPTQNAGPTDKHKPPFGKLDWFMTRGVSAQNPQVVPARSRDGGPISDHDMLVLDVIL